MAMRDITPWRHQLMPESMRTAPPEALADYTRYLDMCALVDIDPPADWSTWWERYRGDYAWCTEEIAAGASEAGRDTTTAAPAAQNAAEATGGREVPAGVPPTGLDASAAHIAPWSRPAGQRSLRNDIAREVMTDYEPTWLHMRRALERAQIALDCAANWVLVFGPQALIDEVAR